ncbi:type II toxin-antitoxin system RelE/ParE family toxin [uncultured Desulfovibrio sp.]|uniref:type II toxin-antitoxin system RelE/ParE family toxin n=1 Tax=uncultured Desulfovibrio sp. TaxID=167968 RepID=UPI0025D8A213|nr:type II toxin-antitoxin system RelE/ParE family toxin [uncultured Desulfovibrio sp.]
MEMLKTGYFDKWLTSLRDGKARMKIVRRIEQAEQGNFGDHKNVDGPVWEMRIDYGPGYRLYYAKKGETVYLLLCGGDKSSQQTDIRLALEIWRQIHG